MIADSLWELFWFENNNGFCKFVMKMPVGYFFKLTNSAFLSQGHIRVYWKGGIVLGEHSLNPERR